MSNAPSLTAKDVRDQVKDTCDALSACAEALIAATINRGDEGEIGPVSRGMASSSRISFELALDDFRGVLFEALTGIMPSGYVNSTDVEKALTAHFDSIGAPAAKPRVAARHADAAARADANLTAGARDLGESICAAIGLDLPLTFEGVR